MDDLNCMICFQTLNEPITTNCGHSYCRKCAYDWYFKYKNFTCPTCRCTLDTKFPSVNITLKNLIRKYRQNNSLNETSQQQQEAQMSFNNEDLSIENVNNTNYGLIKTIVFTLLGIFLLIFLKILKKIIK
jgi:hypothetical protein